MVLREIEMTRKGTKTSFHLGDSARLNMYVVFTSILTISSQILQKREMYSWRFVYKE